jgi:hypothetical protein
VLNMRPAMVRNPGSGSVVPTASLKSSMVIDPATRTVPSSSRCRVSSGNVPVERAEVPSHRTLPRPSSGSRPTACTRVGGTTLSAVTNGGLRDLTWRPAPDRACAGPGGGSHEKHRVVRAEEQSGQRRETAGRGRAAAGHLPRVPGARLRARGAVAGSGASGVAMDRGPCDRGRRGADDLLRASLEGGRHRCESI